MIVKWRTSSWGKGKIERIECSKETAKTVWHKQEWCGRVKEKISRKVSGGDIFHDTWEAAYAHLLEGAERRLTNARNELQSAQSYLGNIRGLRPPQTPTDTSSGAT